MQQDWAEQLQYGFSLYGTGDGDGQSSVPLGDPIEAAAAPAGAAADDSSDVWIGASSASEVLHRDRAHPLRCEACARDCLLRIPLGYDAIIQGPASTLLKDKRLCHA